MNLAGVMTWSINRDTNHRKDYNNEECNADQTGLPDGTFNSAIYRILNEL